MSKLKVNMNSLPNFLKKQKKSNEHRATNNIDLLDKAFLRSGRFGAHIKIDAPDLKGTEQIFNMIPNLTLKYSPATGFLEMATSVSESL